MPDILLLDVMDTLVWDPFRRLPDFFGCRWRDLLEAKHPTAWVDFETDTIDEATFLATFFTDGRAYDHGALLQLFEDGWRLLPGIEDLLTELAATGVPMHALSNYPRWSERLDAKLELSRWLQWSFVSWKTGVRKPDARAYTGPAEVLGVEPADCLFVDDRASNVDAALALGMDGVVFESAEQLRGELVRRGMLPA